MRSRWLGDGWRYRRVYRYRNDQAGNCTECIRSYQNVIAGVTDGSAGFRIDVETRARDIRALVPPLISSAGRRGYIGSEGERSGCIDRAVWSQRWRIAYEKRRGLC